MIVLSFSLSSHSPFASYSKTPRPEHLIVKLKAPSGANNAKVILIRQPKGPDGTKGFNETKQQQQQPQQQQQQQQVTTSD